MPRGSLYACTVIPLRTGHDDGDGSPWDTLPALADPVPCLPSPAGAWSHGHVQAASCESRHVRLEILVQARRPAPKVLRSGAAPGEVLVSLVRNRGLGVALLLEAVLPRVPELLPEHLVDLWHACLTGDLVTLLPGLPREQAQRCLEHVLGDPPVLPPALGALRLDSLMPWTHERLRTSRRANTAQLVLADLPASLPADFTAAAAREVDRYGVTAAAQPLALQRSTGATCITSDGSLVALSATDVEDPCDLDRVIEEIVPGLVKAVLYADRRHAELQVLLEALKRATEVGAAAVGDGVARQLQALHSRRLLATLHRPMLFPPDADAGWDAPVVERDVLARLMVRTPNIDEALEQAEHVAADRYQQDLLSGIGEVLTTTREARTFALVGTGVVSVIGALGLFATLAAVPPLKDRALGPLVRASGLTLAVLLVAAVVAAFLVWAALHSDHQPGQSPRGWLRAHQRVLGVVAFLVTALLVFLVATVTVTGTAGWWLVAVACVLCVVGLAGRLWIGAFEPAPVVPPLPQQRSPEPSATASIREVRR